MKIFSRLRRAARPSPVDLDDDTTIPRKSKVSTQPPTGNIETPTKTDGIRRLSVTYDSAVATPPTAQATGAPPLWANSPYSKDRTNSWDRRSSVASTASSSSCSDQNDLASDRLRASSSGSSAHEIDFIEVGAEANVDQNSFMTPTANETVGTTTTTTLAFGTGLSGQAAFPRKRSHEDMHMSIKVPCIRPAEPQTPDAMVALSPISLPVSSCKKFLPLATSGDIQIDQQEEGTLFAPFTSPVVDVDVTDTVILNDSDIPLPTLAANRDHDRANDYASDCHNESTADNTGCTSTPFVYTPGWDQECSMIRGAPAVAWSALLPATLAHMDISPQPKRSRAVYHGLSPLVSSTSPLVVDVPQQTIASSSDSAMDQDHAGNADCEPWCYTTHKIVAGLSAMSMITTSLPTRLPSTYQQESRSTRLKFKPLPPLHRDDGTRHVDVDAQSRRFSLPAPSCQPWTTTVSENTEASMTAPLNMMSALEMQQRRQTIAFQPSFTQQ